MVPRRVSVTFRKALSGEPVTHKTKVKPTGEIRDVLMELCVATGRAYPDTALLFQGQRLLNSVTLARCGIQGGAVELAVVAVQSEPTAQLQDLSFELYVAPHGSINIKDRPPEYFDAARDEFRSLSPVEWLAPAFHGHEIVFWEPPSKFHEGETKRSFLNKRGYFTVHEMVHHIIAFENVARPKSRWWGGKVGEVDTHHVFFEGIQRAADGHSYFIVWGS